MTCEGAIAVAEARRTGCAARLRVGSMARQKFLGSFLNYAGRPAGTPLIEMRW
jgi:hypothetical protein